MSIRYERYEDHVVLITIDRPDAMNALDREHNEALRRAFLRLDADDDARVGVLTGAGDHAFCAGADLLDTAPAAREAALAGEPVDWHFGGITRLPTEKPVVAAVNGHALAGGLELALTCDLRVASPQARLGLAETRWGLVPGAGGTVRPPHLVPAGIAMEMVLTAQPLDADRALAVGLVNRVVAADVLLETALALAATIARRGPLAVASARRSVRDALGLDDPDRLERERREFTRIIATDDARTGIDAFVGRCRRTKGVRLTRIVPRTGPRNEDP